jgi:predicted ATPase
MPNALYKDGKQNPSFLPHLKYLTLSKYGDNSKVMPKVKE